MHKYKIGDKVRIKNYCSGARKGEIQTLGLSGFELYSFSDNGTSCCSCQSNWELVDELKEEPKKTMTKLTDKFALLFKGEPEVSFIKAGIMNSDETFTPEGEIVYTMWRFKKDKEAFNKEVVQPLLAEKE